VKAPQIPGDSLAAEEATHEPRDPSEAVPPLQDVGLTGLPVATTLSPELSYRQAQSLRASRMIKQLKSATLSSPESTQRSKVLLVEDNIINMKVHTSILRILKAQI